MDQLNVPNNLHEFQFKVLAVDDDYNHLLAIENKLTSFGYQVLISQNPEHALTTIFKGKTRIDIIVCGISSSNVGACNLIQTAKSVFNIPVISMVSDLSNKVTIREIMSGAAQCVAKLPFSDLDVLKNIWHHVVSTRKNDFLPQIESTSREVPSFNPNLDLKIREEKVLGLDHDHDHDHHKAVSRKRRFNWTEEYHQMFLDGIEHITLKAEKIVPATLLKYMHDKGVSHVKRENIASHLQKHRSNCKRHKHESDDFANSDMVTNKQHCPPGAKTQNVEKEKPPITNEIDDWWDTLEEIPGLEIKSTSSIWPNIDDEFTENNIIPTWPIEISDSNINYYLDQNQ